MKNVMGRWKEVEFWDLFELKYGIHPIQIVYQEFAGGYIKLSSALINLF